MDVGLVVAGGGLGVGERLSVDDAVVVGRVLLNDAAGICVSPGDAAERLGLSVSAMPNEQVHNALFRCDAGGVAG